MKRTGLNRRDFHKLTMAAFGGMVAGTAVGCGVREDGGEPTTETGGEPEGGTEETTAAAEKAALNACRGLNVCKGHGKGEHDCAGRASCFTVEAHDCAGLNTCKNLGGCGTNPGANECAEKGGCSIPMMSEEVWQKARNAFEERMKAQGKEFGPAPAAEG